MSYMNKPNGEPRRSLRGLMSWIGGGYLPDSFSPEQGFTDAELQEPLQFHTVHGKLIQRFYDNTVARRTDSYCNGLTFTQRPVKVLEKVYVNVFDVDTKWTGGLRIGFTTHCPFELKDDVPPFAIPNLSEKSGYMAERVFEDLIDERSIVFFYFDDAGVVHYGMNGVEEGILKPKVVAKSYLFALIDVYGNSKGAQLVNGDYHYNNPRAFTLKTFKNLPGVLRSKDCNYCVTDYSTITLKRESYHPYPFSFTKGRNIILSDDRLIATKKDVGVFGEGYLIFNRPWIAHECVAIKVLKMDSSHKVGISMGVTSYDPNHTSEMQLASNVDVYWKAVMRDTYQFQIGTSFMKEDQEQSLKVGDFIVSWVDCKGVLMVKVNNEEPQTLNDFNSSKMLWMYLDLSGSVSSVKAYTSIKLTEWEGP